MKYNRVYDPKNELRQLKFIVTDPKGSDVSDEDLRMLAITERNGEIHIDHSLVNNVKVLFVEIGLRAKMWCYENGECTVGLLLEAAPVLR